MYIYNIQLLTKLKDVINTSYKAENKRIRDYQKISEIRLRQCMTTKNVIFEKLMNERGPWGAGVEDSSSISWMIDCTENKSRMRLKLRRNIPILLSEITRPPPPPASSSSSVSSQSDDLKAEIWKDLMKYRNKSLINNYEESDDDVDNNNNNDDDTENHDISLKPLDGEKVFFNRNCEIITPARNTVPSLIGVIEVTKSKIMFTRASGDLTSLDVCCCSHSFIDKQNTKSNSQVSVWFTQDIVDVARRNFQSRFVAIELFFSTRKTLFLNLYETEIAYELQKIIRGKVKPPNIAPFLGVFPSTIVNKTLINGVPLILAWQNRDISNFEYLMRLNTIAGRSYNDLGQYPVFPWILADYSSTHLNLNDRATFRDLEWPLGAQTEEQREVIRAKYAGILPIP